MFSCQEAFCAFFPYMQECCNHMLSECCECAGLILAASGQMDSYISGGHGSSIRNPTPPTLGQADSASSQDTGLSEWLEKL
jgi:hypothetical protein